MIIYINGRGMNAPELKAYISELEAENAELRAKAESDDRQIAEYKRLLKAAVADFRRATQGCIGIQCDSCPHTSTHKGCVWRYADEALALIGEDGDTNG